jgi:hypothetical protein
MYREVDQGHQSADGRTALNVHKIYGFAIAGVLILAVIVGFAWSAHVKDEAKRDAVIDSQKDEIGKLYKNLDDLKASAQAQISALEKQKQTVISAPAQAPTIIREVLPQFQQTQPLTKETLPDAPSATLSKQDELNLAQYILTCKQCGVERDELQAEVKANQEIIERQKTELASAMKSAKGGTVWQRTKTIVKWGAIFGGIGYVAGRVGK